MWQDKHAERLSDSLPGDVTGTVDAWSPECGNGFPLRCCQILSVVVAVEGQEFISLETPVHVDGDLHVLGSEWGYTEADLQSTVLHRTEVGQQLVVDERWHGYGIFVEHVGSLRLVIVYAYSEATVPQRQVKTCIEGFLHLPFQIGVGIAGST